MCPQRPVPSDQQWWVDNTTSARVTLSFENVTGASHYFATDNSSANTCCVSTGWHAYPAVARTISPDRNWNARSTDLVQGWSGECKHESERNNWFDSTIVASSEQLIGERQQIFRRNGLYSRQRVPCKGTQTPIKLCLSQGQNYISGSSHPENGADSF